MFGWSLIQSFRIAVRGTETTEIDCRCSKQLWQMNVPCVNIWKVNKVNKSVQRVRKNSWIKDFGGAWTGHCRILTILETAIIIIHCIWLLYFITQTRRQSTMCCSVHLTPTWEGCRAFFFWFVYLLLGLSSRDCTVFEWDTRCPSPVFRSDPKTDLERFCNCLKMQVDVY